MTEQIHNLYITSANKNANEKNYNYNLYFSNYGIKINPDEEAFLNITSFQSLNTFYNINSLSCNFVVKVYNTLTQPSLHIILQLMMVIMIFIIYDNYKPVMLKLFYYDL